MRSRAANLEFYKWFNNTIMVPFVQLQRTTHEIPDTTVAWYQLDGEQTQINVYNTPEMLGVLHNANIVVGKPPGSTSSITQACDREKLFIGPKTSLKRFTDEDVVNEVIQNDVVLKKIERIIDAHHLPICKEKDMKTQHVNIEEWDSPDSVCYSMHNQAVYHYAIICLLWYMAIFIQSYCTEFHK